MSICQRIISDHKGTLDAGHSSLGGAEFTITLPLANPPKD
ncbi:MAG: hypothetical protein MI747_12590 [Desulfobacterales bacterium]|nr:hypothetical protein [Desulfobacterales bacterium]